MSYNRPTDIVKFLIGHHPFVLSGADDALHMESVCEAFWGAYKQFHGSHKVFETHGDNLSHVIPLALHGDEGKGKRRSSTVIASLEAVVGIKAERTLAKVANPPTWTCLFGATVKLEIMLQQRLWKPTWSHTATCSTGRFSWYQGL